ncbi:hypothetical protein [Streptomyces roseochromogenus]|uniref:hypothetical protein n=1 Tax=Streptomyces roseochromogenus TaxID=285450 RepID=UPI000996AE48|nr:hypothetical protein [Streptomyces roseochromogenus]
MRGRSLRRRPAPAVYDRLRGARADVAGAMAAALPVPEPVRPETVGRDHTEDVVLSSTERADRWLLRVDTRHRKLSTTPSTMCPECSCRTGVRVHAEGPPLSRGAFRSVRRQGLEPRTR